jgi:HAMP domain-containing protein
MDVDFDQVSNDEIGNLARAFKRMKLSLEMAMKRLKNAGNSNRNTGESF